MPNRIHVAFVAAVLATAAFGIAQTGPVIKQVPVSPTSPASGKQMYNSYCAVCHGVDGRGVGGYGVGLSNVIARLRLHYGDDGSFTIREMDLNRVQVSISFPLQLSKNSAENLTRYGA